jgi:hypothetical protein
MNALIRRSRKGVRLISDGNGRGRLAPLAPAEPEDAAVETPRRVVDGSADGGKGRDEGPPPTKMNQLIRELAFGAYARTMRQGD